MWLGLKSHGASAHHCLPSQSLFATLLHWAELPSVFLTAHELALCVSALSLVCESTPLISVGLSLALEVVLVIQSQQGLVCYCFGGENK